MMWSPVQYDSKPSSSARLATIAGSAVRFGVKCIRPIFITSSAEPRERVPAALRQMVKQFYDPSSQVIHPPHVVAEHVAPILRVWNLSAKLLNCLDITSSMIRMRKVGG